MTDERKKAIEAVLRKPGTFSIQPSMPPIERRMERAEAEVMRLKAIERGQMPDGAHTPTQYRRYIAAFFGDLVDTKPDPATVAIPLPQENIAADAEETRLHEEYAEISDELFDARTALEKAQGAAGRIDVLTDRQTPAVLEVKEQVAAIEILAGKKREELRAARRYAIKLDKALTRQREEWRRQENEDRIAGERAKKIKKAKGKQMTFREFFYDLSGAQLQNVLETLSPREREVLEMRCSLKDGHPPTLGEVELYFNVTRERIRQIEAKALRRLRHPNRSRKLKDYIDHSK